MNDPTIIAEAIEAAILRELKKWDGGEMLPRIAEPLANHLRRRVLETLSGVKITWSKTDTTACVPRIPTDAMVQAGREAGCFGVRKGEDGLFSFIPALDCAEVYNVWRAMWDEAMKENQYDQK